MPKETTKPETKPSPVAQFFGGVGEGAIELVPQIALGLIFGNSSAPASSLYRVQKGDLQFEGAGDRAIDALNEVNPLYAAGVDAVDGANAYERGDFVGMGRATLGFGVTVLMTAITLKGAKTTRGPPTDGRTGTTIQTNRIAGAAFEESVATELQATQSVVAPQITIRTPSGTRTRVDFVTRNGTSIGCVECKASSSAPLTRNQAAAFPELDKSGGVVVGKGKPGVPGGTVIPPGTRPQIVRPK